MGLWVRRTLALVGIAAALVLGSAKVALAETTAPVSPKPTAAATAPSASPTTTATDDGGDDPVDTPDTPDAPQDDRTLWLIVGAGVLALAAGAVVFLRR